MRIGNGYLRPSNLSYVSDVSGEDAIIVACPARFRFETVLEVKAYMFIL